MRHEEYDIVIRSPQEILPCERCEEEEGDFCWSVKNDHGEIAVSVKNLCGACVMVNTLDYMQHGAVVV